jgi:transcriptional regulator GlxA family with amidase domain
VQLDRAQHLLADTALPLDAVAARAGFRDGRYLCAVFARTLGLTPGEYRRQTHRPP